MTDESKNLTEAIKHSSEAAELLKESKNIQQLDKQGMIEEDEASVKIQELNNQAIEEAEKAIELQKDFINEQESK